MIDVLKNWGNKTLLFWALLFMGAMGALIFPYFKNAVLGYIALILFFSYMLSFENVDRNVFKKAYVFSFSFFVVGFSWICNALLIDGDAFVGFIPVVILAIGLFFGLFIAVPCYLMRFGKNIYSRGLILCLGIVFFEWVRSFIFTGFPWNLFGSALSFNVKLIQGARYIGTYGLSFLLLLFLVGVSILVLGLKRKEFYKGGLVFVLASLISLFGFSFSYQSFENGNIKVRLVQPAIEQSYKWDNLKKYQNYLTYIEMSKSAPLDDVDIVVWGETATPYVLDLDKPRLEEIKEAIGKNGFLITGLIRYAHEYGEFVPYNSLFVINKEGEIKDYYDKSHLVPFGEFLPFREYLPDFMRPVANVVGNLGRGEKYKNIKVKGLPLMGGAICYESIFPKEVLNKKQKPEILVVLANDGWYGISSGPYQHLVASQLRAVEEGISVIRSANTGISAVIKPNGDIVGQIGLAKKGISDVYMPKILSVKTLYGELGNLILLVLFTVGIGVLFVINKSGKK